jgi:3-dehydroquinate synthase
MTARRVRVALGARAYDVRVGAGALAGLPAWLRGGSRRAFVVSDEALVAARGKVRRALTQAGWRVDELPVCAGERLKDMGSVYPLYGRLLELGADRHSVLFALGGGTVGDAAGFVASTYMRGIRWVSLPTTLLAQLDSGVGGKTGINHEVGKNLIGSFHQPSLVVCDTDLLATLDDRDVVSGLGEAIKIGLVYDPRFCAYLVRHLAGFLARDARVLNRAIVASVAWKARAVARDEHDRSGEREALNFGHTFGHALEAETRYRGHRHGEAVIWGMRFALALSQVRGVLASREGARLDELLASLPVPPLPRSGSKLLSHVKRDKKARDGRVRFVLLKRPGRVLLDDGVTAGDLEAAWTLLQERTDG